MLINKIIFYLLLPLVLLSDEPGEHGDRIRLGGDIFLGRKVISHGNNAPGFRVNRPISGINLIIGKIGSPLNLKLTSTVARETRFMSDINIQERGIGIQREYRRGKQILYASLGMMSITLDNNHVGDPSDNGKGYWTDIGIKRDLSGRVDFGLFFRYSSGDKLLYASDNQKFYFDMGGYSLSLTYGIGDIGK